MDIERILKTRENAIYYGIGEYQKDCFGWVGGNAPACFKYSFYIHNNDNDLIVANALITTPHSVVPNLYYSHIFTIY